MFSLFLVLVLPANTHAEETPPGAEEPGFSVIVDRDLFSSGLNLRSQSALGYGTGSQSSLETNLEIEMVEGAFVNSGDADALDSLLSDYQPEGEIKRLSTSWHSEAGSLTVGSDWSNFEDLIGVNQNLSGSAGQDNRNVTSQIKWLSPNGFSIALENSSPTVFYSTDDESSGDLFAGSPSIILSWHGGTAGSASGEYRVTAASNRLNADASGQKFDGSDVINWGLNLEGGWQIGDLFSALSVTFGKGINSYLLQKFGNDLLVTPNESTADEYEQTGTSFGIRPSLYYSLNDNSTFHVALGHYSASGADSESGVDTLDTIHMGYSWSPWPTTRFGLELVDQNIKGPQGGVDEVQVKFEAEKQF